MNLPEIRWLQPVLVRDGAHIKQKKVLQYKDASGQWKDVPTEEQLILPPKAK